MKNARQILSYDVEAFADLGIHLDRLSTGDKIPELDVLPKYHPNAWCSLQDTEKWEHDLLR